MRVTGTFVVVEGIEASGKSTLVAGLAAYFARRGREVVRTREPGGTPLGDRLREVFIAPGAALEPLAEAFLLNASRAQHVGEVIEPALRAGRLVLCDRFAAATLAYQGYGRGVDLESLAILERIATGGLRPDLTLLVDVPVDVSRERLRARARAGGADRDRLERESAAFHARVRRGYLTLAKSDERMVTLDGTQPAAAVLQAACGVLAAKFEV